MMKSILIIEPESRMGLSLLLFLLEQQFWVTVILKEDNNFELSHPKLDTIKLDYMVFKKLKTAMEGHHFLIACNSKNEITLSHIENFVDAMMESHLNILIILNDEDNESVFNIKKNFYYTRNPKVKVFTLTQFKSNEVDFNFSTLLSIIENN